MSASPLRAVPQSADSIPVCITRFKSPSETTTKQESNTTWGGIVRGLENADEHASKAECPMFVGAVFGDKRTPARSLRHNANVLRVTTIVGDYDGEQVPMQEAERRLQAAGVEAFVFTTASNTPEKPRWRVVAPLSGPRDPSEHHKLVSALNGALHGILNAESWTLSQAYFFGRVRDVPYETARVHGQCIDLLAAVELLPSIDKPGASAAERSTTTTPREKPEPREKVADALKHVPADCPYPVWTNILMAVHESDCEGALDLADEWSATAPERYAGSDKIAEKWGTFTRKPGGLTVGTLYKRARDNGWQWQEPVEFPPVVLKRTPLDWAALSHRQPAPRDWYLNEWLSADPTLLAGRGGIGKSLIAQAVGSALALGCDYLDAIAQSRTVLYWACEDDHDELWRRQMAIAAFFGVELPAFADKLIIVPRRGEENTLLSTTYGAPKLTPLMDELRAQVNDYRADVLILDNVGQTFGGNENCRHDVTMYMNAMAGIGAGRPVAPIVLAHPARAQGSEYAGNAAWENAARMRWFLSDRLPDAPQEDEKEPDALVRYISKRKSNYTTKDYRRLIYQAGVLVPDAAPVAGSDIERKELASAVVIDAVTRLTGMGLHANNSSASPAFLPRLILEYKLEQGCTRKELADAMRLAMTTGKLKRAVVGKHSNRSDQFGLVATG